MAIDTAFPELRRRLEQLRDCLDGLRLTVVEDKPLVGDVALIDHRTDVIEDLLSAVREAIRAANRGRRATKPPLKLDVARAALCQCQESVSNLGQRLGADLTSYERMSEIVGLGRHRGGEWRAWASEVTQAIRQCEPSVQAVTQALFTCWRELAEHAATATVSVRATAVGQKVTWPAARQPTE